MTQPIAESETIDESDTAGPILSEPDLFAQPTAETSPDTPTPQPKAPKRRVKAAKADPADTTEALERIHTTNGSSARHALQRTVERFDALLRDTTPPKVHPSHIATTVPPAWLRRPGLVLRARAEAAARLRWLERRAEGIRDPFVEPTVAELVQQFTVACRFSTLTRLGAVRANDFSTGQSVPEGNAAADLGKVRVRMNLLIGSSYLGHVENLSNFRSWRTVEAKLAVLRNRETRLADRLDRIRKTQRPLAPALESAVRALLEETGIDLLAKAVDFARNPDTAPPPTTNDAIRKAEDQIGALISATHAAGPLTPDRSAFLADIRKPFDEAIRRNRELLAAQQTAARAPIVAGIRQEVWGMGTTPLGWRTLGELADRHPWPFPKGFADRWLAVVADTIAAVDPASVLTLIDAA